LNVNQGRTCFGQTLTSGSQRIACTLYGVFLQVGECCTKSSFWVISVWTKIMYYMQHSNTSFNIALMSIFMLTDCDGTTDNQTWKGEKALGGGGGGVAT
jgi:hypothetical protein